MEIRSGFHHKLKEIQDDITVMGKMDREAVTRSITALKNRDIALAHQIVADDQLINHQRFSIENKCIELIATQQPLASDLRVLVAVLNIIIELERIGDYAEGIAKIVIMIGDEPPLKPLIDIPKMADKMNSMLERSVKSFIDRDATAALQVAKEDDEVDHLYDLIFEELLGFMTRDPGTVTRATRLIWVAHNLERAADRVTNICERVVYTVTGKMEEIGVSKY